MDGCHPGRMLDEQRAPRPRPPRTSAAQPHLGGIRRGHGAPASSGGVRADLPHLPPFAEAESDTVRQVGKPAGSWTRGDQLSAGPKALIVDPSVNGNPTAANPYGTNPDDPAGSRRSRQFVDHDITFDQTSQLGDPPDNPALSPNTRTPALDDAFVAGTARPRNSRTRMGRRGQS